MSNCSAAALWPINGVSSSMPSLHLLGPYVILNEVPTNSIAVEPGVDTLSDTAGEAAFSTYMTLYLIHEFDIMCTLYSKYGHPYNMQITIRPIC